MRSAPQRALPVLAILAVAAAACGDSSPGTGLEDPGFEAGGEAWARVGNQRLALFEVSDAFAHGGSRSGRIPLDSGSGVPPVMPTRAATAGQEVRPEVFPERLTGFYRVEEWQRPADDMGLEIRVVVHAFGDPRTPQIVQPDAENAGPVPALLDSYGLVWRLAGREAASQALLGPSAWANLDVVELGSGPPALETWQRFDLPLREDFQRVWGAVPEDFDRLRVLLQVLWTDRGPAAEVVADVYFDDLELAPPPR